MTKRNVPTALLEIALLLLLRPVFAQAPSPQPLTLPLECASGDCPLLGGAPQTAGLRSGSVRLKPGETVGWHSTGQHEEALVIVHGRGEARIEGQPARTFTAPKLVYIPTFLRPRATISLTRARSSWSMCTWWRRSRRRS
jgi:hypothetical protein